MPQGDASPKIEYVDVPAISETYADSVRGVMFDGQSVRLELCVTRMDEPKNGSGQLSGRRQTACRVVLPLSAALDLSSKLGRMMNSLAKQGAEHNAKQTEARQEAKQAPAQGGAKPS
jgi:hypothetical protein